MATSISRRWLYAALFIVSAIPLSALAQSTDLAIAITDSTDPVVAGSGADNLTHTITVTNTGLDTTGVIVQRTGSPAPTGVVAGITPPAQGTWDGEFWDIGALANGASVTLDVPYTVDATAVDGDLITSIFSLVNTDVPDSDPSNDQDITESTTIAREFDLGLSVVDNPDPVLAGSGAGNLTHTFTLSRSGPSDAAGVQVDLTPNLPSGVALDSAVPTVGSVAGTTWTVGDWPASENGNDQTLTLTLTVDSTATDCTDCVSATGTVSAANGTDTNPANDTAVDPTSIETAASVPSGFLTTVAFTNGYAGTVGVTISCNNGLPLTQSKDISEASGVNFIVSSLDFIAPGTECDISVDVESGYVAMVLANGEDTGGSCIFSGTPVADESAAFAQDRANTCEITAEPVQSQFIVHKDWVTYDDGNTEQTGSLHVWCTPAAVDTGNQFGTVEDTFDLDGNGTFYLDFYPAPGGATCYAEEDVDSSAVESSSTCAGGVPFAVGDVAKTCAITNTVFFEGIPTLSQYGLAILALLMLGIGFVGLRRFV